MRRMLWAGADGGCALIVAQVIGHAGRRLCCRLSLLPLKMQNDSISVCAVLHLRGAVRNMTTSDDTKAVSQEHHEM